MARSLRLNEADTADEEPAMLMTSMIDVIFILLAFFVCVTELKKGHLMVDVPKVGALDRQPSQAATGEPIVVEVTAKDEIFVGGERAASDEDLARLIAQAAARAGKEAPVHLQGDKQARNGTMMRVVSQLSKAGLLRIEFAVQAGG